MRDKSFRFIFKNYKESIAGIIITSAIISLQLFIWHKQTGHFLLTPYGDEKFYFKNPNIINAAPTKNIHKAANQRESCGAVGEDPNFMALA